MTATDIFLGSLSALSAGGFAWYCVNTATQLSYVTLADGRQQERSLPLLFRLLIPLAPNVRKLVRNPVFNKEREQIGKRIVAAGFEGLLTADEFLALRFLLPAVAGPIVILILWLTFRALPGRLAATFTGQLPVFSVLTLLWMFVRPAGWLRRTLAVRQLSIQRALPFVLDLLTLSVEAGLDFMTAIKRIVDHRKMDPLGEELLRMFREVQVGKTRREALRDLAARTMHPDLGGVVHSLVQADELGVSIGYILRIQSDQMRERRFQRAEKLAQEAPVKMLFPLIFFIFPSVFVVLLGPVILDLLKRGM